MQTLSFHGPEPAASDLSPEDLLPEEFIALLKTRAPGHNIATSLAGTAMSNDPDLAELATAWLTDRERHSLDRFSFPKRRNEWLSGRICAKRAILDLFSDSADAAALHPLDISIEVGQTGRPRAIITAHKASFDDLDISISHSHGAAIGIAGYGLCGVDIQHLSDTLFRVKSRFCNEIEVASLETIMDTELVQLGLLWVSKEAIRKCFSDITLLGFLDMRLERITMEQGYRLLHFALGEPFNALGSVSVTAHVHNSYALAICTVAGERLKHAGIA